YAQDPKAVCLVRLAWVDLWAGDAGRADERARSALELAVDLDHLMTLWYVLPYAAIIAAESEDLVRLAELLGDAELLGKRLPSRYLMIVGEALRGWLDVCEGSPGGIERSGGPPPCPPPSFCWLELGAGPANPRRDEPRHARGSRFHTAAISATSR